jgi:hypothetical protein
MPSGTVVAVNRSRSLVAFRLRRRHQYAIVHFLDGWVPNIGEKVDGDFTSLGDRDIVYADRIKVSVRVDLACCTIDVVNEMLKPDAPTAARSA